jgi:hypothetical protein
MISGHRRPGTLVMVALALVCLSTCGLWEDQVLDNRSSGVPCDGLPDRAAVDQALNRHGDLVSQLVAVAPGLVHVDANSPCADRPNATEILITYGSHEQRTHIENLLRGGGFGVPVSLQNV